MTSNRARGDSKKHDTRDAISRRGPRTIPRREGWQSSPVKESLPAVKSRVFGVNAPRVIMTRVTSLPSLRANGKALFFSPSLSSFCGGKIKMFEESGYFFNW